jgi:hypothetical protein
VKHVLYWKSGVGEVKVTIVCDDRSDTSLERKKSTVIGRGNERREIL